MYIYIIKISGKVDKPTFTMGLAILISHPILKKRTSLE